GIHVEGRPEWVFVKIHTHGAPESQAASLLGDGGRALHQALAHYNDGRRWQLHYVTAREMYNVAMAAMEGRAGNPAEYRDYLLAPPPWRMADLYGRLFRDLFFPLYEERLRGRPTLQHLEVLQKTQWRPWEEL